jgi:PadR family transcriptional regulator
MEYKTDILQGTLDLMVLQTLASMGPLHGYAIATRFEQVSHGSIQLNMGTLYPALVRLEQRRLIRGKWAITANNRRARLYEITVPGRRQLERERTSWRRTAAMMSRLLDEEGSGL